MCKKYFNVACNITVESINELINRIELDTCVSVVFNDHSNPPSQFKPDQLPN